MRSTTKTRKPLSELEHAVMKLLWAQGPMTADAAREGLLPARDLKDSTVRTILRRLEEKGYADHTIDGRTYVYRGLQAPQSVAARAVRQIIDRFCGGSVERLLVGMVENEVVDARELETLARRLRERTGD
ncbi:MAG TPA: BlaI/MecI/CopY family transcriptional regulator [Bryobacteraceae bacterium]|nr:BlaI/MecI/CopY family transcriptional regulator [Bryobacteraceae bacterium]